MLKLPSSTFLMLLILLQFLVGQEANAQQSVGFMDPNVDNVVFDVELQPGDGKILIGGDLLNVGGQSRRKVARLNPDGSLDTSFQDPAIVGQVTNDRVLAVKVQTDGKVLVGGLFSQVAGQPRLGLVRLNADGSLDTGFNPILDNRLSTLTIQPDSKILIAGFFTTVNGVSRSFLARLNPDGSLDSAFQPPSVSSVSQFLVQSDGRILILGNFDIVDGQTRLGIARLNTDGSLDTGFNVVVNAFVKTAIQQPDGLLVIGGEFGSVNGAPRKKIARINLDGSLDKSFQPVDFQSSSSIFEVKLQSDGKVMVGGDFAFVGGLPFGYAARLNADGSLDNTFQEPDIGGTAKTVYAIAVQPNGKTIIGGAFESVGGRSRRRVARLNPNGSVDEAPAVSFTVNKTADTDDGICDSDCSLREAISEANATPESSLLNFDENVFGTAQTITLTLGELVINNPDDEIFINGPESNLLTISGNDQSRIFRVERDSALSLLGLTLTNGNGVGGDTNGDGGAIFVAPNSPRRLSLSNCIVQDNTGGLGGGIYASGSETTVNIVDTTIMENTSTNGGGGGIHFAGGTIDIVNSAITDNTANVSSGGGIVVGGSSTLNLVGSVVSHNVATFGGGVSNAATTNITDSLISDNSASSTGGGIYNSLGVLTLTNSTISNNFITGVKGFAGGGGLSNVKIANIDNSVFSENSAPQGGGILNSSEMTITGSTFQNNTATGSGIKGGGAIYNNAGGPNISPSSIQNSVISNNHSNEGFGGGIYNRSALDISGTTINNNDSSEGGGGIFNVFFNGSGAILNIYSSTIALNSSDSSGGGILNQSGTLNVVNSTFSSNQTAGFGGGINNTQSGAVDLLFATIAFNSAGSGGGLRNNVGTYQVQNTVVAKNMAGSSAPDVSGSINSGGYNLISDTAGITIKGDTTGNQLGVDPLLDARLGDNGGATVSHLLKPNSPAIDAGNSVPSGATSDQRGYQRPYDFLSIPNPADGADIGAFERQADDSIGEAAKFDFDGDSRSDISVFRPGPGEWWYLRSSDGGNYATQFGAGTDAIVPADYTGDGKADIAFFRPAQGEWFVLRSEDSSFFSFPFGTAGDIPAPGDFDGDGKADPTVFRPASATWFILRSSDGGVTTVAFGANGDQPTIEDYDGDGKDDIAIYRPSVSEWWINRSQDGLLALQFGSAGDQAVPADYTGDGKADVSFFRPSTGFWFVLRSEDTSFFAFPFGSAGDIPAPGDFDGDGTADPTVFRPAANTWFKLQSTNGFEAIGFGIAGDRPVPNAYVVE